MLIYRMRSLEKNSPLISGVQVQVGVGVHESTLEGVYVFQQEVEQDREWIFSFGTGAGARPGVIFYHSAFEVLMFVQSNAICDRS